MILTFGLANEFDFLLCFVVTTPLITPDISIDWIGSFWGVEKSRQFYRVYQSWFVLDSAELFQRQASKQPLNVP